MDWHDQLLDQLSLRPCCGYQADAQPAAEPTALTALALAAWGRKEQAQQAAAWLTQLQAEDGSVGVRDGEPTPRWPTGLAVLAWIAAHPPVSRPSEQPLNGNSVERAIDWILGMHSKPLPQATATSHDTKLIAWPWVEGTHAWVEPTAFHVLALKAAGHARHPRTREAVQLLLDRQLPDGGCNYGNTLVLGRQLRPHLQPTGIAMTALGGTPARDERVDRSLDYLAGNISRRTPSMSLCWSLLGLRAHGRQCGQADSWLADAAKRVIDRDRSPHKMSLLLLAHLGNRSPLITLSNHDDNV
jgi:hypothetical protein